MFVIVVFQELGSSDDSTVAVDTLMEKFPDSFSSLDQRVDSRPFAEWKDSAHPGNKSDRFIRKKLFYELYIAYLNTELIRDPNGSNSLIFGHN